MKLLLYHERQAAERERNITERAAKRAHMLKKTILWDLLMLTLLLLSVCIVPVYAPLLAGIPVVQAFIPVCGSIWEQLKLLYYPAAFTLLLRYIVTGDLQKGILTTGAQALLQSCLLAVMGLCTLKGVIGTPYKWQNIAVLCFCSIYLTVKLRHSADTQRRGNLPGMLLLLLMEAALIWCTYHPPSIALFAA